ncbi:MAG: PHP domain-containing protein [Spirochaetota bacterium]
MVDLHTHTTESDGLSTPTELVALAASLGIHAVAVTDHDTIAGVGEARGAGARHGVHVIAGVELEAAFDLGALHVLGLGLTHLDGAFAEGLETLREDRARRNRRMLSRLSQLGIDADYGELAAYAEGGVVARPHFAQLLIDRRFVDSYQEAFDRYLADGAAAHEPREAPSLSRCIELIHSGGGKAIVAHPRTLWLSSWRKIENAFDEWKGKGLDGVEAYHTGASPQTCRHYAEIARNLGLLVSAGSDYHGKWGRLGRTCEDMDIDDHFATPFLGHAVQI